MQILQLKNNVSDFFMRYRILWLMIVISFAMHILWLSAVKVVVSTNRFEVVKFSKVSFLGPILAKGAIEVKVSQKRFFLERRYLSAIARAQFMESEIKEKTVLRRSPGERILYDENLNIFVDEAVSGSKLEPAAALD